MAPRQPSTMPTPLQLQARLTLRGGATSLRVPAARRSSPTRASDARTSSTRTRKRASTSPSVCTAGGIRSTSVGKGARRGRRRRGPTRGRRRRACRARGVGTVEHRRARESVHDERARVARSTSSSKRSRDLGQLGWVRAASGRGRLAGIAAAEQSVAGDLAVEAQQVFAQGRGPGPGRGRSRRRCTARRCRRHGCRGAPVPAAVRAAVPASSGDRDCQASSTARQ